MTWMRWISRGRRRGVTTRSLSAPVAFAGGLGLGAVLLYELDPERGRQRRARLRDQALRAVHLLGRGVDLGARDLSNRASGLGAEIRAALEQEQVPDDMLVERVRAELGRFVSHPHSVEVSAADGRVVLAGPILAREHHELLRHVRRVRGVREVEDRLAAHRSAAGVPGLQGGVPRPGRRPAVMRVQWRPALRLLAGVAGGGLGFYAGVRRGLPGALAGALGLGLFARAAKNLPVRRLVGVGAGRRVIELHKTVEVNAPLSEVFALWRDLENLPRIMEHVREVRVGQGGRSRWRVAGPAGASVEWDAEVTALVPDERIAWRTLPGQAIEHAGVVRFEPAPGGGTRLDIRLAYNPPGGALGHAVAALFHADPKTALDEDMLRLKSLLEEGKATAHGETITREDLTVGPRPTV